MIPSLQRRPRLRNVTDIAQDQTAAKGGVKIQTLTQSLPSKLLLTTTCQGYKPLTKLSSVSLLHLLMARLATAQYIRISRGVLGRWQTPRKAWCFLQSTRQVALRAELIQSGVRGSESEV